MTKAALTFALLVTAAVECRAQTVVLRGEFASAQLKYDCRHPRSHLPDSAALAVIQDYSRRLGATVGRAGDMAAFRRMNDLYVAKNWRALERLTVREACAGRLPVLAFPSPGAPAPDFALPFVDGRGGLTLRALRGRIVVLDFWGSWCGSCLRDMPSFVRLANDYPARVAVVGIVMREPPEHARKWLKAHPPGRMLHVYTVEEQTERQFQVGGAGYKFVLDTLGRVMRSLRDRRVRMDVDELRDYLARLDSGSRKQRP